MKFSVELSSFRGAVNRARVVAVDKSPIPILSCIRIVAESDQITIHATNQETSVQYYIPTQNADPGETAVPAGKLAELLKNLTTEYASVRLAGGKLIIESGGKYQIPVDNPVFFPIFNWNGGESEYQLTQAQLQRISKEVAPNCSTDEFRPALSGIRMLAGSFAGTDSYKLAKIQLVEENAELDHQVIARPEFFKLAEALGDTVAISYGLKYIEASTKWARIQCRVIEDKYPPLENVIRQKSKIQASVKKADFIAALKRVSLFADKEASNKVLLSFLPDCVTISAESDSGNAEEIVTAELSGAKSFQIAFNCAYLLGLITSIPGDQISLNFETPNQALQVEQNGSIYLIMPVRVQ